MKRNALIIFDMDGVLIDVTGSYREVTRLAVVHYLRDVIGARIRDEGFITPSDVAEIKRSGGLNNDWDLTNAIINAILGHSFDSRNKALAVPARKLAPVKSDTESLQRIHGVLKNADRSTLEKAVVEKSAKTICLEFEGRRKHRVDRRYTSPFLVSRRDVGEGNISKRIFQELYLGKELFSEIYGFKPLFHPGEGYIDREEMIPSTAQLEHLLSLCTLSIATGRPGVEAEHALKRFGIQGMFSAVVSEDDVVSAERSSGKSLRKPHPFSLNLCLEKSGYGKAERVYYIGDMPDDMLASKRAGVTPIGFVNDSTRVREKEDHRNLLKERGAHKVFGNYADLIAYFQSGG